MISGRLIPASLAIAAFIATGTAAWMFAPEISRLVASPPAPAAAPAEPPRPAPPAEPPAKLGPNAVADLSAPEPDAPSPLLRIPWVKPAEFCRSLGNLGLANPTFQGGVFPLRSWTCLTDLLKPTGDDGSVASSVFVTARGDDPERLDALRIKLNLIDPKTTPVVKTIAKDLLRRIYLGLGWRLPEAVLAAIDGPTEGRIDDHGVSFDLRKEFGPALRYNLIISFPQRLGAGGEDSFYSARRRPQSLPPGMMQPPVIGAPPPPAPSPFEPR